mgnify:CR=1 FL=1
MSAPRLPAGVRIGCVPYLNAKPLIRGIERDCLLDHPARLAEELFAGRLDAALVPVAEWFRHPEFAAVDGVGICCDGAVYSVVLAGMGALRQVDTLLLDEASRTSALLARLLLRDTPPASWRGLPPASAADWRPAPGQAALLIGSQAISLRQRYPAIPVVDLGAAWKALTGLPFVFAVWLLHPGFRERSRLADSLRAIAADGMRWRTTLDPGSFEHHYLNHCIQFPLDTAEKHGLAEFRTQARLLDERVSPTEPAWL